MKAVIEDTTARVRAAVKKANVKSFAQAGAYVRGIARRLIRRTKKPSAPGTPPHSPTGKLKDAIIFHAEPDGVVIGATRSAVGGIAGTHEFSGVEPPKFRKGRGNNWRLVIGGHGPIRRDGDQVIDHGFTKITSMEQLARVRSIVDGLAPSQGGPASGKPRKYPARPFMRPALEIAKSRLPEFWANAVRAS